MFLLVLGVLNLGFVVRELGFAFAVLPYGTYCALKLALSLALFWVNGVRLRRFKTGLRTSVAGVRGFGARFGTWKTRLRISKLGFDVKGLGFIFKTRPTKNETDGSNLEF